MQKELFDILADKYLSGRADETEKKVLFEYMDRMIARGGSEYSAYQTEDITTELYKRIRSEIQSEKTVPFRKYLIRYAAAAAIIFAVAITYFLVNKKAAPQVVYTGNVAPGKQGSKIKLSDGRIIMIDTIKEGLIAMDGGMRISKKNGRIVYEGSADESVFNEVFAEKGRESEAVVLPDGSTAWLNAGSSLRYPLRFASTERMVAMTGEIYFEVAHNAKQPFRVKAGDQTIEDIGTIFNVNAYSDEPAAVTTLVEGSIKIQGKVLQPGQAYSRGEVVKADVSKAIAWHKGLFSFQHADIPAVMRQMARWYNVEVKYEGNIPDETFSGKMERSLSLNDALDYLKQMHVHFRIEEDKRIVVLP